MIFVIERLQDGQWVKIKTYKSYKRVLTWLHQYPEYFYRVVKHYEDGSCEEIIVGRQLRLF